MIIFEHDYQNDECDDKNDNDEDNNKLFHMNDNETLIIIINTTIIKKINIDTNDNSNELDNNNINDKNRITNIIT